MFRSNLVSLATAIALLAIGLAGSPVAADDSRWYLDGQVGQSSYQTKIDGAHWVFDDDDRSATFEVGFIVNPYLAIEAGYHDLGTFDGRGSACARGVPCVDLDFLVDVVADVSGLSLAAVPTYPINDRLSVYAKVGLIDWTVDVSLGEGALLLRGQIDSLSGQDLLVAAGARYEFGRGFGLAIEHQEYDFDVQSTVLGLSYSFGSLY